jgi:hypothetical protein
MRITRRALFFAANRSAGLWCDNRISILSEALSIDESRIVALIGRPISVPQ